MQLPQVYDWVGRECLWSRWFICCVRYSLQGAAAAKTVSTVSTTYSSTTIPSPYIHTNLSQSDELDVPPLPSPFNIQQDKKGVLAMLTLPLHFFFSVCIGIFQWVVALLLPEDTKLSPLWETIGLADNIGHD